MISIHPLELVGYVAVAYALGYATCALLAWAKNRIP